MSAPHDNARDAGDAGDVGDAPDAPDALLLGPRGRRLCMALAARRAEVWEALYSAAFHPADEAKRELTRLLGGLDPARTVADAGERGLMGALGDSVDVAMYWEEPDAVDSLLADRSLAEALRPLARAVRDAPETGWWPTAMAPDAQAYVQWISTRDKNRPPPRRGAAKALREWRAATLKDERDARSFPEDPSAPYSGIWSSTPASSDLPGTSRALPWLGAVLLMAVEDGWGWTDARVWPVRTPDAARVYEITGPEAWTDLVRRYPLRVGRSRRHDWWRTTGRVADWRIPDWEAVAADFDAVHLTVTGYLTTAGRALDVGGTGDTGERGEPVATVLAGWDPDITYWLTDTTRPGDGGPADWRLRDDDGDEQPVWVRRADTGRP